MSDAVNEVTSQAPGELELPGFGLDRATYCHIIAKCRKDLQSDLQETWRRIWPEPTLPVTANYDEFIPAFHRYAVNILEGIGRALSVEDVEGYLDRLKREVVPAIVAWIEPNPQAWTAMSEIRNFTPTGEWEHQIIRTYESYRSEHPTEVRPLENDIYQCVIAYQIQLRDEKQRLAFHARITRGLEDRLVVLEDEAWEKVRRSRGPRVAVPRPGGLPDPWESMRLTPQQKDLLMAIVDRHLSNNGAPYMFAQSHSGSGFCSNGPPAPPNTDVSDFVQIQREGFVTVETVGPNVIRGKPTQLGIRTVASLRSSQAAQHDERGYQSIPEAFQPDANAQPLGNNPFPPDHPAHEAFEEATWTAKEAISDAETELLDTMSNPPFDFIQAILTYRVKSFAGCANAALLTVGNAETAVWYEHWIDDAAKFLLEDTLQKGQMLDPKAAPGTQPLFTPELLPRITVDLHVQMKRVVALQEAGCQPSPASYAIGEGSIIRTRSPACLRAGHYFRGNKRRDRRYPVRWIGAEAWRRT